MVKQLNGADWPLSRGTYTPNLWHCTQCDFACEHENEMQGHIRNVHGWKTNCGCQPDGTRCVWHTLPKRCTYALPGLGRCVDTSGVPHGHWFRPGHLDEALVLTLEEARELTDYMRHQYVNPNSRPVLSGLLTRLDAHVKVTA